MLNRWLAVKQGIGLKPKRVHKPWPTEVTSLGEAEKFRSDCVRRIASKVSAIQNASLGESKLRDLNDHINRLIQEKKRWEAQILALGGRDYTQAQVESEIGDADLNGKPLVVNLEGSQYFYFGAAKDLPGVKELLEARVSESAKNKEKKKQRENLYQNLDARYYGFRGQEDEESLRAEELAEQLCKFVI
jgi:pre-mRNA-splicing factor ISY1